MSSQSPNATILVVDPSPISLTAVAGVLDTQGYECYCARTADAAQKAVKTTAIDLIVWDVGNDAAVAITEMQALRSGLADVPIIVLAESCWAGLETRLDLIAPSRCLFKPLDPATLIDLVQQSLWVPHVLRGHHLTRQRTERPGWITL